MIFYLEPRRVRRHAQQSARNLSGPASRVPYILPSSVSSNSFVSHSYENCRGGGRQTSSLFKYHFNRASEKDASPERAAASRRISLALYLAWFPASSDPVGACGNFSSLHASWITGHRPRSFRHSFRRSPLATSSISSVFTHFLTLLRNEAIATSFSSITFALFPMQWRGSLLFFSSNL